MSIDFAERTSPEIGQAAERNALILIPVGQLEEHGRHLPLNTVFQTGPTSGKDVFMPIEWIVGGREYAGKGWMMLMSCLAAGRSISLPTSAVGGTKAAARFVGAYARVRSQFKTPIGKLEGVEEALGRIAANCYMMEATRIMTAGAVDAGEEPAVISAIAKYHMTERARKVCNDAMDIHGGKGICLGPNNGIGRGYQSIPVAITWPTCEVSASSNSREASAPESSFAARISRST